MAEKYPVDPPNNDDIARAAFGQAANLDFDARDVVDPALYAASQRIAELESEKAMLREHTLGTNPNLRQLHDCAVAYMDAVAALSEVRGGAPLSTTIGWLIRNGILAPVTPDDAGGHTPYE